MVKHSISLLQDYINSAPIEAIIQATEGEYQKFHRKKTPTVDNINESLGNSQFANVSNFYSGVVYANDSLYVFRPSECKGTIDNILHPNSSQIYQMQYKLTELATDVRVSYVSEKYPWIEAVYKFKMVAMQPGQVDFAVFVFVLSKVIFI